MSNEVYGYVRVSTEHQNEDRQLIAMAEQGVPDDHIYADKKSGKDFDRPAYRAMIETLRPGDLVYIKSIDRLGRDYDEIQKQWKIITKDIGADIYVIDMPLLDTRNGKDLVGTLISDIVLQVLSFVAQNERENIHQRQMEGIAAAKARGVQFGRPTKPIPENFDEVVRRWESGEFSRKKAAELCGMCESTFYSALLRTCPETLERVTHKTNVTQEERRAKSRAYYMEHRDECMERRRRYEEEHPEKRLEYERKYRETHRERLRENSRKYYWTHRDEVLRRQRERYGEARPPYYYRKEAEARHEQDAQL